MSATLTTDDLEAIKGRQQATWASGDYAVIGTTLQLVGGPRGLLPALDGGEVVRGEGGAHVVTSGRRPV